MPAPGAKITILGTDLVTSFAVVDSFLGCQIVVGAVGARASPASLEEGVACDGLPNVPNEYGLDDVQLLEVLENPKVGVQLLELGAVVGVKL